MQTRLVHVYNPLPVRTCYGHLGVQLLCSLNTYLNNAMYEIYMLPLPGNVSCAVGDFV